MSFPPKKNIFGKIESSLYLFTHESYMAKLGFELAIPGSAVGRATDCAIERARLVRACVSVCVCGCLRVCVCVSVLAHAFMHTCMKRPRSYDILHTVFEVYVIIVTDRPS